MANMINSYSVKIKTAADEFSVHWIINEFINLQEKKRVKIDLMWSQYSTYHWITGSKKKNNTLVVGKVNPVLCPFSCFLVYSFMKKIPKPFYTYRVLMERRGANNPLLIVCSLLSYSDSRLRFCRSWKVLTLKQLILLAFSSLKHKKNLFRICYLSVFVLLI